jgi:hypothetical protein
MPFRAWLLRQADRGDPVGAYVREFVLTLNPHTRHHFTMRLLRLLASDLASAHEVTKLKEKKSMPRRQKIPDWRRIATRFDRNLKSFMGP